jgi:hypothetical protein
MDNVVKPLTVFVSSGQVSPELRDVCLQVSWDAGHSARGLISTVSSLDVRREIQHADILVRICAGPDEATKSQCFWAADSRKPFIVLAVGAKGDLSEFHGLEDCAAEGSQIRAVSEDKFAFAKEYLVALHRAVRVLDADGSRKLDSSVDPRGDAVRSPFLRRLDSRISRFATLHSRFSDNAYLKRKAAEFFLDQYLDLIIEARLPRWFFESGSSIATLTECLTARLPKAGLENTRFETNNFLSYLEFILNQQPQVSLYPPGTPDDKYGGTFGDLRSLRSTPVGSHPIRGEAYELVKVIKQHFAEQYGELGLIFGATSGIDFEPRHCHPGPHVGSYENMLFKRALLESNTPLVLFLDEDKLPRPALSDVCYSVCDEDFPWEYACRNTPLALACAFRTESNADKVIRRLEKIGLGDVVRGRQGEAPFPVIAANTLFASQREVWTAMANPSRVRSSSSEGANRDQKSIR